MTPRSWRATGVALLTLPALLTACAGGEDGQGGDPVNSAVTDVATDTAQLTDTALPDTTVADTTTADTTTADTTTADTAIKPECVTADDCPAPGTACVLAACKSGKCATEPSTEPCDDGDVCTKNDRCTAGACQGTDAGCECTKDTECAAFDDGNDCNGTLYCNTALAPHRCRIQPGTPVQCDPAKNNVCSAELCDPTTGKCAAKAAPDGTPCDDGDPCPVDSFCKGGTCKSTAESYCQCKADTDCQPYEDGDACNGTLYCDKQVFPPKCAINPASVVHCAKLGDDACTSNGCDPGTGKCATVVQKDGAKCDDATTTCKNEGACKDGTCIADTEICACTSNADCAAKEDGDYCNGTLFCDKNKLTAKGTCKINPATTIVCATVGNTDCAELKCVPTTGACAMQPANEGKACSDGEVCTVGDACKASKCAPGKDTCACASDADCASTTGQLGDGNKCNGEDFCNLALKQCQPNPKTFVVCQTPDDTACLRNACEAKTGACVLTHVERTEAVTYSDGKQYTQVMPAGAATLVNQPCSDGDACTQGDTCLAGQCTPGADTCACKTDNDCSKFDDGDKCNGTKVCDKIKGKCIDNAASIVVCDKTDDSACLKRRCQPKTGTCLLAAEPFGTLCDDNNTCTTGDYCGNQGGCLGGKLVCACQNAADCKNKFDDGDDCNGVPFCDRSAKDHKEWKCVANNPATVVFCNPKEDTTCSANTCAAGNCGLKPRPDATPCDDNDACTGKSACAKGLCTGSDKLVCNDSNACTNDSCDATKGCVYAEKTGFCEDGNSCTIGTCDAKTGNCSYDKASKQDKPCDADQSGCTVGDSCDQGVCKAGPVPKCNVVLAACEVSKCVPKDANNFSCVVAKSPDGAVCDGDNSPCTLGGVCQAGSCNAGASKKLCGQTIVGDNGTHVQLTTATWDGARHVVGGTRMGLSDGKITNVAWRIIAYEPGCKEAWSIDEQMTSTARSLVGLFPYAGGVLAVGSTGLGYIGMHHAKDGKLGALKQFPRGSTTTEYAHAAARYPGGDIAVVGVIAADGVNGTPTFKRITVEGIAIANSTAAWFPRWSTGAIVIGANDTPYVVGATGAAGNLNQRAVYVVDSKFVLSKPAVFGTPDQETQYNAAVAVADGIVAGGFRIDKGTGTQIGVMARIDAELKLLWERDVGAETNVMALAPRPGGGWFVGGTKQGQATGLDTWLAVLDADANLHTQTIAYKAGDDRITALLALSDGVFAIGYGATVKAKVTRDEGLVMRTDAWGNRSCDASGKCGAVSGKDCDDGKACTADSCNPLDGTCSHTSTDGFACTGGGCAATAVCEKGACVPKGDERLWLSTAPKLTSNARQEFADAVLDNGAQGVLAHTRTQIDDRLWRLDALGKEQTTSVTPSVYINGFERLEDGDILVPVRSNDAPAVRKFSGDAATTRWTEVLDATIDGGKCQPAGSGALGHGVTVHAMQDGTIGALITATSTGTAPRFGMAWARITANGKGLYKRCYPPPQGVSERGRSALVQKDGTARLIGALDTEKTDAKQGTVVRWVANDGTAQARVVYAGGRYDRGIAVDADTLLAGWAWNKVRRPGLLRIAGDGAVRWRKELQSDGEGSVVGLAAASDHIVLVRSEKLGFKQLARLEAVSTSGELLWSQALENEGYLLPHALAPATGGGWWLAGETDNPTTPLAFIARIDRWGHASCALAGGCFGKGATGCDDGDKCTAATCAANNGCGQLPTSCDDSNACTTDACDKKAGCTHKPTTATCDDGNKCTAQDACKSGLCVGVTVDCNDNEACSTDTCEPATGCAHEAAKDGTACPITNGCSTSATCKSGTCTHSAAGKLWVSLPTKHLNTTADPPIEAVAIGAKSTAGLFRLRTSGEPYNTSTGTIAAGGAWLGADSLIFGGSSVSRVYEPRLMPLANGEFVHWVRRAVYTQRALAFHRLSSDAKRSGTLIVYSSLAAEVGKDATESALDATPLADGTLVFVGSVSSPTYTERVQVLHLDSQLKLLWRNRYARSGTTAKGRGIAGTDDGGMLVVGQESRAGVPDTALALKIDATGKQVFFVAYPSAAERSLGHIVRDGGTGHAAAGHTYDSNKLLVPWLARINLDGSLRWQRELAQPSGAGAKFVGRRGDGSFVLAGDRARGLGKAVWLQWTDARGNPTARVDLDVGTSNWLGSQGVALYADGGLLIGGAAVVDGTQRAMLVRMDAWGHAACLAAGDCAGKTPGKSGSDGCNDGKPCTADSCDATKGCVTSAVQCDDANACTTDSCDAAKGCVYAAKTGACDDDDVCTTGDACSKGTCAHTGTKTCDDANACTLDTCHATLGCQHQALDAVPCQDASQCALSATCDKGTCTLSDAGKLFSMAYDASSDGAKHVRFETAAIYDGAFVAISAYEYYDSKPDRTDTWRGHVSRYDVYGRPLDQNDKVATKPNVAQVVGGSYNQGTTYVRRMRQLDGKKFAVLSRSGWWWLPRWSIHLDMVDADKGIDMSGDRRFDPPVVNSEHTEDYDAHDFAKVIDGTLAISGGRYTRATKQWDIMLIRTDGTGQEKWKAYSARPGGGDDLGGPMVVNKSGHVTIAGSTRPTDGVRSALLLRFDNGGDKTAAELLWRVDRGIAGKNTGYRAIEAIPTGGLVTAGWYIDGADVRPLIAQHDDDGNLTWQKYDKLPWPTSPHGMVRSPDGSLLIAGHRPDGIVYKAWVRRLTAGGVPVWTREYPLGTTSMLGNQGLLGLDDGGALLLAGTNAFSRKNPGLIRINAWGDTDCKAAGVCRTTGLIDCTQKCAGKLALCDAKTGCTCK